MRHDEVGQLHDLAIEEVELAALEFHFQQGRLLLLPSQKLTLVFGEVDLEGD